MLRFVLDEHLRGPLWAAIQLHNQSGGLPIDVVRVGDPIDLPLGNDDPTILLWCEREDRILLTEDVKTMPTHLVQHIGAGRHSPGVVVVGTSHSFKQIVAHLELVAHAGNAVDYENAITYIP